MQVCYFGSYARDYSRNRCIIKGLRKNNVKVVECQPNFDAYRLKGLWRLDLLKKHATCHYDIMIIGFPGHSTVPFAKGITRKPIVFDAFNSLYDSMVLDRKLVEGTSFRAKRYFCIDKFACKLADLVLLDTNEHIKYFCKTFGFRKKKFKRIFAGTDDEVMYPRPIKRSDDDFIVFFYGSFIPLQGIEYIIKAAKLLESHKDIKFQIVGSGQTYKEIKKLSEQLKTKNVSFLGWKKYEDLPKYIANADVCLGIFGKTNKASRVIPNKVFDALAMKKPVITVDSPAAREVLRDRENCILCKMANPHSIAKAILTLKADGKLREKIANNGYLLFKKKFTPKTIGKELKKFLMELLK